MAAIKMSANRKTRGKPTKIDIYVGHRVRTCRLLIGMSQKKLAADLGLTFQQVQKYEKGTNRIGAGQLFQFASALGVSVGYFFDGLEGKGKHYDDIWKETADIGLVDQREILEIVRAYHAIPDPFVRASLHNLLRSVGQSTVIYSNYEK